MTAEMFNAANTEHIALYAKLRPLLLEMRATTAYPDYLEYVERVVLSLPEAEASIAIFRLMWIARPSFRRKGDRQEQGLSHE